ncbi:hypothetical protein BGX34_002580 [Mortierella sp. NVP85]|nr:hypothetical protein BGX34_002580 [Mortierella sp. NVP85]
MDSTPQELPLHTKDKDHPPTDADNSVFPNNHPFSVHTPDSGQETPTHAASIASAEHEPVTAITTAASFDTECHPVDLMDSNEPDTETVSIVSNQSYSTAPDYEEELLFENDKTEHTRVQEEDNHSVCRMTNSRPGSSSRTRTSLGSIRSTPRVSVDSTNGLLINIEPTALLQQQMTILHPALSTLPIPSTVAPTVYALASSVPHPTVRQLSMNLPNQAIEKEQVAVPFKTILCPPAAGHEAPVATEEPSASISSRDTWQTHQDPQLQSISPSDGVAEHGCDEPNSADHSGATDGTDDIHPYFATCNLPKRVSSRRHNRTQGVSPAESALEIKTGEPELSLGVVSPPTSAFSTPSFSSKNPIQHTMSGQDPTLAEKGEPHHAQTGGGDLEESRITKFGFASMSNHAGIQLCEEQGSQIVHGSTTEALSGQAGVNAQSIPHVRAGISPALNLDHIESVVEAPRQETEESVESLVNSKDWSTTGLGPRSSWPVELSILVPVLMKSASPLAIYWGDQSYLLYNDPLNYG